MRRFVVGLLAVIGFFTLLGIGGLILLASMAGSGRPTPPERIVLQIDWRKLPQETASSGGLDLKLFGRQQPSLSQTVALLQHAAKDSRVAGLVATLGDDGPGIASVQELRDAIAAFRASGKFAIAFAETFDEGAGGLQNYYLATAFDKIWVQPTGDFGVVGLAAQVPFLKGALDRVGVRFEGGRRLEYKTAPNSFTEAAMTAPQRENLQQLMDGLYGLVTADIATARKIAAGDVRSLIDRAPLSAQEALQARLIDKILYGDEAKVEALLQAGTNADLFAIDDYAALEKAAPAGDTIALIVASGTIVSEAPDDNPLQEGSLLAVDRIVAAIAAAARDKDVKALVVRIDSPGGGYVASDTLRRALERAKAGGKPVIVSVGDVAASGGYFAALPADAIVAHPGSITGSIGVFSIKPVVSDLLDMLGIKVETLTTGANATMSSPLHGFTPQQQALLERQLDRIYADFTAKVSAARKLEPARLDRAARGRVFTGTQAKAAGLVDEIGGLTRAIELARTRAGIDAAQEVQIRRYPAEKEPIERLLELVFGGGRKPPEIMAATDAGATTRALARRLNALGLYWHADTMRLPPLPPLWR
ncbi:signal peptide peptidase SppA [Vineibacter terrae]|uniref:Signal peptide peptidase SppA n=1 Tax=Vineibacter terrae TaxID=2586908 RepID=A0A5C8PD47_9HYPH|nr:signal peptide peptidase SppA [Vineibacter terrae]TXL71236.1 signal peptide peptidase SppA [Vineibacter terrae]